MNGILVVNKPTGKTSHQVVSAARKWTGIRKIGHAGTLDPDVTGVLPLFIGWTTRLVEFLMDQPKSYRAKMRIGFSTTTQDASGDIVEQVDRAHVKEADVEKVIASFIGTITQIPPIYSALKIQGQRAYDLARAGETPTMQPRQVLIYSLQVLSMDLDAAHPMVEFDVTCSKGTYIRTLCQDIGAHLGYPAHMTHLVRTRTGPFELSDAHAWDVLEQAAQDGTIQELLADPIKAVEHLPRLEVNQEQAIKVSYGQPLPIDPKTNSFAMGQNIRIEDSESNVLAIYQVNEAMGIHQLNPYKVFSRNDGVL